ncbi:MAG: alkaline phosphatase family protein [Acidobacteriota bacterium]
MRLLRMLSNAVIGGTLAAAYLTILVLHLNPAVPLTLESLLPLVLVTWLTYGVNLATVFYALIVIRLVAGSELLSPGWVSVRVLSWLGLLAAGGAATVMWLNVRGFGPVLDPTTVNRMTAASATLTASAVVFLVMAVAHVGRRGGRVSAALLTAMMVLSLAAPLAARGWGSVRLASRAVNPVIGVEASRSEARVILLAFDGATLDVVSPAVAEGRLPNVGRLMDGGAVFHLATLRPTQAEPVWSAAVTGRGPSANGVRSSARFHVRFGGPSLELLPDYCFAQILVRLGFLAEEPHDSRSLRVRPLWDVLGAAGVSVGVVGFPLTHPARTVNGFMVSDELHRLSGAGLQMEGATAVAPPSILADVLGALEEAPDPDPAAVLAATAASPQGDADARPDPAPIGADRMHLQILDVLNRKMAPRFVAARFPGLDAVAHYFLRYANPSAFGDVTQDEQRRFGRLLGDYYGFIDALVGRTLASLGPDDLLLVVSPFGMEPLSPGKRVIERLFGNAELSGSHERAPDGFVLAYGGAVAPGRPARASVLDLTPTILYYFGLPVARDMEGFARTDIFRDSYTATRPITFIPTYDLP